MNPAPSPQTFKTLGVQRVLSALLWVCCMGLNAAVAREPVRGDNAAHSSCDQPLYLTFDTGHMGVAPLIAEVLKRHQVRVTFFVADEPAKSGGSSLGEAWQPWWRERALEGHQFASHTLDHVYWLADLPNNNGFRVKPSAGVRTGQVSNYTPAQYCQALEGAAQRIEQFTSQPALPLFRAPGGKTSAKLIESARACGFDHVGWSDAGFLGDELPSQAYPNALLLKKALDHIRTGDILMAHLGIWSRQDPWAPAVLEPLLEGLERKGFCFRTLDEHPRYREWIVLHPRSAQSLTNRAKLNKDGV